MDGIELVIRPAGYDGDGTKEMGLQTGTHK